MHLTLPLILVALVLAAARPLAAAHTGPVPAPADGFGAPGPYAVETRSFPSPGFAGQEVTVFAPAGLAGPRPTWFFCHGFGGYQVVFYAPLLRHLASHGWCAVFSPYPITGSVEEHYDDLLSGFVAAVTRYPDLIDTRRVGFAGHSFGGGAAPGLLLQTYRELGWGIDARCLMPLAPWYSYRLTDADLAAYPAGTQVVMQVYEDDIMNDHRMAIDVFRRLGLPAADKDFIMLVSDEIAGYGYNTGHNVPGRGAEDAIFERGLLRVIAALSASCFAGDPAGRAIALGGGTPDQVDMGTDASGRALRPMVVSDDPVPRFPLGRFEFPFSGMLNPRAGSPPPEAPAGPAHLVNLSVRAYSETGGRVLVAGAALEGTRPKGLLVRAAGPALVPYQVSGAMTDPRLELYRGPRFDLGNDTWGAAFNLDAIIAATRETFAFSFPAGSADAALCVSFAPGTLTAHVVPAAGAPGVALVELYDADLDSGARLVNLSGRAYVSAGDSLLVAGFSIRGSGTVRLLIRAVGPSLARFEVPDLLPDPRLVVQPLGGQTIAENDDWGNQGDPVAITTAASAVSAFSLPTGSKDACLLVDLPAGSYTAHATDTAGRSGNVLVEVYAVP
ncbi:MAG: hypothetical protein IAE82_17960 [Opitutaceae bacterium]|nr:hypothetical protein [Opitutaceae bacterium]